MALLAAVLLGVAAADVAYVSPADELQVALSDLTTRVSPLERCQTRYVSLASLPPGQRAAARDVVSFVLNSVSRTATIVVPDVVEGSDGRLLRFSLARYGLPVDVWEALVADEPYWHIRTQVQDPRTAAVTEVFTDGGWVGLKAAATLREEAASSGAIVRGDWLVTRLTAPPWYYRFANIPKKEADFFTLLGLDLDVVLRLRADRGANMIRSNVTRQVRRLVRRQTPLGGAWQTYDVASSSAEHDPIRNLFAFAYDAGEHIATKPNGLHYFALYDAEGQRQDAVPADIARDTSDLLGDGQVVPMISCVRCHEESGLRPFSNDQRRLLQGNVELLTQQPENAERLASFYGRDMGKQLSRDREDYDETVALLSVTLEPAEVAPALGALFRRYAYELVSTERASDELGARVDVMVDRLRTSHDPVLLALSEGLSVQREQWEVSFAEAAILMAGEDE